MGKKADISPKKYAKLEILLKTTTKSQRDIAKLAGVSASVVNRVKKRLNFSGLPCEPSKRIGCCGRKRVTTPRTDRTLINISKSNRKLTTKSIQVRLGSEYGINISTRTVRRRLVEAGLNARRPRKKPKLTPVMIKKRKVWAKKFLSKGSDYY